MQYVTESMRRNDIMELLYADDIALPGETVEEVLAKYHDWKTAMERKGLKVNVGKTKALSMPVMSKTITALDPCSVCGKRFGANSIMCTICKKWVHRRCSGLRGKLVKFTEFFQFSACTGCQDTQPRTEEDFGELEQICKFTYLGHCIDASGDMEVTVTDRIQSLCTHVKHGH